jgi:hypothetical protein
MPSKTSTVGCDDAGTFVADVANASTGEPVGAIPIPLANRLQPSPAVRAEWRLAGSRA